MELKDFIKAALKQIVLGVLEAQNETTDTGAIINPSSLVTGNSGDKFLRHEGWRHVEEIEINVAVSVTEGDDGKSGIGVMSISSTGGESNSYGNNNTAISTIKFKIPVALPAVEVLKNYTSDTVF